MQFEKKNTTNEKINLEKIDFSGVDEKTRKTYTDFYSGFLDIYKIVGVSPDDTDDAIRQKCNKRLAELHPDRINNKLSSMSDNNERQKEKNRLLTEYNLVRDASSILKDPHKRKLFDLQKKSVRNNGFTDMKDDFKTFIEMQDSKRTEESEKLAQLDFNKNFDLFDKKHGINRNDTVLSKDDMNKRVDDLFLDRKQQDIECMPDLKLDMNLSSTDFNKQFNKMWEKQYKSKQPSLNKSVVVWDGMACSDDIGTTGDQFIDINSDYSDLYIGSGSTSYETGLETIEENSDTGSLSSNEEEEAFTEQTFNEFMRQRELETDRLNNLGFTEFGTVMDNPLTVSSQLGKIVGDDNMEYLENHKQIKNPSVEQIEIYKKIVYGDD